MGMSSNKKKGIVFIVSAPSGAGKTTLVERYIKEHPQRCIRSVSCTTRPPRKSEVDGKDYFFLSEKKFMQKLSEDAFLEHAKVFDYYYGTLKETVEEGLNAGKHVFLVIDTQGAELLKNHIEAQFIFIMPPSIEALQSRLIHRETEDQSQRELRLSFAKEEMKKARLYDKIILNDNFEQAYQDLTDFIHSKECEQ